MSGLTFEQVVELHDDLLVQHGGRAGLPNPGALHSALAQVTNVYFGVMRYPTPQSQAAAYLYYVASAHAFTDGNKRTAMACCLVWLRLHQIRHFMSEDLLYDLAIDVADNGLPIATVYHVIAFHSRSP